MDTDELPALRPGAGENEIRLHVALVRDELERTANGIRARLDLKTHALRGWTTFRRDYEKDPAAFNATAAIVGTVAAGMLLTVVIQAVRRG